MKTAQPKDPYLSPPLQQASAMRQPSALQQTSTMQQNSNNSVATSERKGINLRTASMFFWTLLWSVVGIAAMVVDPRGRFFSYLARRHWAKQLLWLGGVKATIRGAEHVDWSKPYVICVNHNSQIDIPVLFACLPTAIRFLAKRILFYIPIFGWMLGIARFIPIDRGNKTRAKRSVEKASQRIRSGPSLLVFPEGTRSPDGRVHSFKSGAFIMAIKANVPVLPIALRGTYEIVSKHHLVTVPGPVELVIGHPIETSHLSFEDKEILKEQTHAQVVEMYGAGIPGS